MTLAGLVAAAAFAISSQAGAGDHAQTAQSAPKNQVAWQATPLRSSWS